MRCGCGERARSEATNAYISACWTRRPVRIGAAESAWVGRRRRSDGLTSFLSLLAARVSGLGSSGALRLGAGCEGLMG